MRQECIQAVAKKAGRTLNQKETENIEQRITNAMKQIAGRDRAAWRAKSMDTRMDEAAQLAADQLIADAQLKKKRVSLTIIKSKMLQDYITDYSGSKLEALQNIMAFSSKQKANFLSVESRANATKSYALGQINELFDATNPRIFGLFENKEGIFSIVKELYGEDSGNHAAKDAAKVWNEQTEIMRLAFNDAGGKIGHLEDWRIPQSHSQVRIAKAGETEWLAKTIGKINRSKYVNPDGSLFSDSEMQDFLKEAYKTLSTGGVYKIKPGQAAGSGARANRGSESRQIHFKDAKSYYDYNIEFGDRNLFQTMINHINGISKDISLVETLGPNPDHLFNYLLEENYKKEVADNPTKKDKIENKMNQTANLYDYVAGKTQPAVSNWVTKTFDTLRNLLIASRLGSAFISSLTDAGTLALTAHINNLPMNQLALNMMRSLNPLDRNDIRLARRAGLAIETFSGVVNRWGGDLNGPTWSAKMASSVMRASGLEAWTEAGKRAYGITMMSAIGHLVGKHGSLKSLDAMDNRVLLSKGITDNDWNIWRLAKQEDWGAGNNTILSPESIMKIPDELVSHLGLPQRVKYEAARKLLGCVLEEMDMAVITPGAKDKFNMFDGMKRGTLKSELIRSFMLFKSFPISSTARHFGRAFNQPTLGGKLLYIGAMVAGTTVLGALAMQLNNIASGRKMQDMMDKKFLGTAILKGGSLGIFGDFLFSPQTISGQSPVATLLGPQVGLLEQIFNLTWGNMLKTSLGEDTNIGADAVMLFKGLTPFQNLWYTKAITDHIIFNKLQEHFSPGYLNKVEKKAQDNYGTKFWWRPQDTMPKY